jgi:nitrogen fixation protein NifU and related proteins
LAGFGPLGVGPGAYPVRVDPRFQQHFDHPRNRGDLDGQAPDGSLEVRVAVDNPVCGDELELDLRLDPVSDRVVEIAWRVRGCSGAVAAASAMSVLVGDASLDAARTVDRDTIDGELGGLPVMKRHGADLAAKGLKTALERLAHRCANEEGK